jgi:hypothetical protein
MVAATTTTSVVNRIDHQVNANNTYAIRWLQESSSTQRIRPRIRQWQSGAAVSSRVDRQRPGAHDERAAVQPYDSSIDATWE